MKTIFLILIVLVISITIPATSFAEQPSKDNDDFHKGTIEWIGRCYMIGSDITVRVIDYDMDKDHEKIEQFDVQVWSDFDVNSDFKDRVVDYTVIETGMDTGIFEGPVFFITTDDSSGKRIRVVDNDVVFAKYVDYTLPNADKADVIDTFVMSELSVLERNDDGHISKISYDSCALELFEKNEDWFNKLDVFYPAPLKQIESGLHADEIECRESLVLVTRHDNSPACVTYHTGEKLVKRGWATCDDGISHGRGHPCGPRSSGIVNFDSYKKVELVEPEMIPLDIASVEDRYVHLNPADMCATVSLRLLSPDDLKQTKSGTKDVVFFDLDDKSTNEFPVLGELIRATHHIEFPSNQYAQTEMGLREFVDYEFFIMEKAIAKYNDTQDDYFIKLDGNLDEKLADPKKQGFSNEFIAPQIVYRDKTYTMGSTVFWVADEHEMQSVSIRLQDNLKEDEKYITLTDKDMDSVPKIKQTIERIGTELESIVAFKGMPENPDWNNHREWFDQKKAEQFNLDDVYVKGFVYEGEHYDLGFLIC